MLRKRKKINIYQHPQGAGCFLQPESLSPLSIREHAFPGQARHHPCSPEGDGARISPAHLGPEPVCFSRRGYNLDDGLFLIFWKELCSGAFWLVYHLSQGCYGQAVLCH